MDHAGDMLATVIERLAEDRRFVVTGGGPGELVISTRPGMAPLVIREQPGEQPGIVILAPIGREGALPAEAMVELVDRIGAGALSMIAKTYVVRFTLPASQLASAALPATLDYAGRLARELARALDVRTALATSASC